jgi:hypothetical protein
MCCLLRGILFVIVAFTVFPACGQDDAAIWQYYPPLTLSHGSGVIANTPMHAVPTQDAAVYDGNEYVADPRNDDLENRSVTSHEDRQFDSETRPSWRPQAINKPMISRPTIDYPSYDAPSYGLEPVRKVVETPPAYVAPEAADIPRYSMTYEQGPAEVAPTLAAPDYRGPNYDVKPYEPPAYDAPTVDRSGIDYHPEEYTPPVYQPEEYRPPRELPPEYMPPPQE